MEAKEFKVLDILTENKRYIIPAYQRPYSWNKDHATQLILDIYSSFKNSDGEYFVGSMICINKGDNLFEVVDGQQRLTTLSLIIANLARVAKGSLQKNLQERVLPIDMYDEESKEPRLTIRSKEASLYKGFILENNVAYKPQEPTNTQLRFIENHQEINNFIMENIDNNELNKFIKFVLEKVLIVFVQTDDFDSSFRLFNVLNNRGLPLSHSDLLKNTLFEKENENKQNHKQIEFTWSQIEDLIGIDDLDKFLFLHKMSEKKDKNRVLDSSLNAYIESLETDFNKDVNLFTQSLLTSAKNYRLIKDHNSENLKHHTKKRLNFLNNLTKDEWIPPVLAFLNKVSNSKFNMNEFDQFINMFEKVYVQGWLKKQVKNKREHVCFTSLVSINNKDSVDDICNDIKQHSDNDGVRASLNNSIYEPTANIVKMIRAILLRLDKESQDDSVDKIYNGRITIEHILPQKMSHEYWKDNFTAQEHSEWVHKLGNLTLISGSKNSEAQNKDFEFKKGVFLKKDSKVSFDLTKKVCNETDWDLQAIKNRQLELVSKIEQVWNV